MTVRVKLFAVAREVAGRSEVEVEVQNGAVVADVRETLLSDMPALRSVLAHVRWAVDAEFVGDRHRVSTDSEIAVIPPVSGG